MGVLSETQKRNRANVENLHGLEQLRDWLRDDGTGHVGRAAARLRALDAFLVEFISRTQSLGPGGVCSHPVNDLRERAIALYAADVDPEGNLLP